MITISSAIDCILNTVFAACGRKGGRRRQRHFCHAQSALQHITYSTHKWEDLKSQTQLQGMDRDRNDISSESKINRNETIHWSKSCDTCMLATCVGYSTQHLRFAEVHISRRRALESERNECFKKYESSGNRSVLDFIPCHSFCLWL